MLRTAGSPGLTNIPTVLKCAGAYGGGCGAPCPQDYGICRACMAKHHTFSA